MIQVMPIPLNNTFYLMRGTLMPKRELPELIHGGLWRLSLTNEECPGFFANALLGVVGGTIDVNIPQDDAICGIAWSRKSKEEATFQIWHKNSSYIRATEDVIKTWMRQATPAIQPRWMSVVRLI